MIKNSIFLDQQNIQLVSFQFVISNVLSNVFYYYADKYTNVFYNDADKYKMYFIMTQINTRMYFVCSAWDLIHQSIMYETGYICGNNANNFIK